LNQRGVTHTCQEKKTVSSNLFCNF